VTITNPQPSNLLNAQVAPTVCIDWVGFDPDGIHTPYPVKYKWIFLTEFTGVTMQEALQNPNSIPAYYAPLNWAGWDSTSAETTFARYQNLTPGQIYLWVVTAFDEVGDYDPLFGLTKNMLRFTVTFPEILGPLLSVQAPGVFNATQAGGDYDDPSQAIRAEVAAGAPLTVRIGSYPAPGQTAHGMRWVLDPVDPADETPRSGPDDLGHWSEWSDDPVIEIDIATGTNFKRSLHRLYFQARSGHGGCNALEDDYVSKWLLEYTVVRPTWSREILIVDDTRLETDRINGATGCLLPYTQGWPSATELDTFLFARGGVPWRCTIDPPTGVLSAPGLFAGFSFDTLGTRGMRSGLAESIDGGPLQQAGSVPLSKLADYRHVIWITDRNAALSSQPFDSPVNPMAAMRHWSSAGRTNVLTTYSEMGGKVWLIGATATAACMPWDRVQNNGGGVTRFDAGPPYEELVEGRMPWDAAHLRSRVLAATGAQVARALGRFETAPGIYAPLPTLLDNRNTTFDPLPPTRTIVSQFNVSTRPVEGIALPNSILEGQGPDPSALDSIYNALGATVPAPMPAMALYHGGENGQVLWTGFDVWSFKRADCAAIVSWVLQDLWGLTPSGPSGAPNAIATATRGAKPRALQPSRAPRR
jgi:hypothetical protein